MILVTGATGTNGSEIVRRLSAAGTPVRALVRNRAKAAAITGAGVEIVEGDLARPETLLAALQGVQKAILVSAWLPEQVELETNFIKAARQVGLSHLVKLSAMGADSRSPVGILAQHGEIEDRVRASGVPFTFLRPNGFMQNFLASAATIAQGALYAPVEEARVSFVDARDIAAVAVQVASNAGHEGQAYLVTGPEALTHGEVAAKLAEAIGRPVSYVNVSPEQYKSALLQYGTPEWLADGLNELFGFYRDGVGAEVADTVSRIGRKEPISFDQFAREHASVFRGASA
jgi:uncharacterized protein YbjT (DUF2867 family)